MICSKLQLDEMTTEEKLDEILWALVELTEKQNQQAEITERMLEKSLTETKLGDFFTMKSKDGANNE